MKVFYDGRNFHGSQVQPDDRTVEGELFRALAELRVGAVRFQAAGRTDSGVSALGNVFAISTKERLRVRELNAHLPLDIRVLAATIVHGDFKPRKEALERIYKYFLPARGLDVKAMRRAAKMFEGEKNFHNFSKASERSPLRKLNSIRLEKMGDFLVLTCAGESFLWQMVRRIANALRMIGAGELAERDLQRHFESSSVAKVPPAPPEGLILWDVRYAFSFKLDEYTLKDLLEGLIARRRALSRESVIIDAIAKELR